MTFLKLFETNYEDLLNPSNIDKKYSNIENLYQRSEGYKLIFSLLENLNKTNYNIVETGVLRNIGNWTDGQSSFLFQEFLKYYTGSLYSVDINQSTCNNARSFLDKDICNIVCDDSRSFLKTLDLNNIDLFFLDSYDVKWDNCSPSAKHHLEEFKIIEPFLKPGQVIAIDDNIHYYGERSGKGRDIFNYLKDKNILPIYDNYMIIYQWK